MQKRNKILITGSSGMLGTDLCAELGENYDLYGIDISSGRRGGLNLPYCGVGALGDDSRKYFDCDITDERSISDIITKVRPEIVIHTAAMTDVDECEADRDKAYRINTDGTRNVASACRAAGAALIHISTDFVFDGKKKELYKEDDKTGPLSVYGDSKLKGEEAIKKELKNHFILRAGWLYGQHGKNFVDTIIAKAKTETALKVVNDQVGSPTYTKDMARAIHILLDKISTGYGTYHVSNSGSVSWYGYAKEILRLAGSKTEVVPISSEELSRPAKRPAMSVLDNSKFNEFTGYKMRDWKTALKEYLLY